jgi:hypothetical protein
MTDAQREGCEYVLRCVLAFDGSWSTAHIVAGLLASQFEQPRVLTTTSEGDKEL